MKTDAEALLAIWTPANESRSWRVRFHDGGIVVVAQILCGESWREAETASGALVRVLRKSATVTAEERQELIFPLESVRDVVDQDTGDMVFPPERAFKRTRVQRFLRSEKVRSNVYGRAMAICVALFGAGMIAVGLSAQREQAQVAQWPTTDGTVVVNVIRGYNTYVGGRGSGREDRWFPEVKYVYEVGGHEYGSTRFFWVEEELGFTSAAAVRVFTSQFKVGGGPVTVHFNPTLPSESYLLLGDPGPSSKAMIVGVVVILVVAVWWWLDALGKKAVREREEGLASYTPAPPG